MCDIVIHNQAKGELLVLFLVIVIGMLKTTIVIIPTATTLKMSQ